MPDQNLDSIHSQYEQATQHTADDLRTIAENLAQSELTRLTLPEVESIVEQVARMLPAGNVPGLILSGLSRLRGQSPAQKEVDRDVHMLFRGVQQMVDRAVYSTFFAGPAAVIWGYQKLLALAGKDPDTAFPEGTWQFYVDYALREDTARHTNETHGFDTILRDHGLQVSEGQRITAWVYTALQTLHQYDHLLENEWRERVYIRTLIDLEPDEAHQQQFAALFGAWMQQVPYRKRVDGRGDEDYPAYRKRVFDAFMLPWLSRLTRSQQLRWRRQVEEAKRTRLPAYQRQMSIWRRLEPTTYNERRVPLHAESVAVGVIYRQHYYRLPIYHRDTSGRLRMLSLSEVFSMVVNMMAHPWNDPDQPSLAPDLRPLARMHRKHWPALMGSLPAGFETSLDQLRTCPILLNFDPQDHQQPLAHLRQGERGIGDHAMTIFNTGQTMVFDLSHIFFDGAWGAALAEIMTSQAIEIARDIQRANLPLLDNFAPEALSLQVPEIVQKQVQQLSTASPEVSVESDAIRLDFVQSLRVSFRQRSTHLQLSVNDLLLLYRAIHAVTYQPDSRLVESIESLRNDSDATMREAIDLAKANMQPFAQSPAILIPVDGSKHNPRGRVYPMSFEVPLQDLHLLELHKACLNALRAYESGEDSGAFEKLQRRYLAALAGFGAVMQQAKQVAATGETSSIGTIRLLAHMPSPMQQLLNQIPDRFEVLNDIIRGREVFSNIGRVAPNSTLTRFITAKDDNEQKTLAWGILTDEQDTLRVSLRDFRPYVAKMLAAGAHDLARLIAQHYLDTYTHGFNQYIQDLHSITTMSSEMLKLERDTKVRRKRRQW